jgi:16S rRNA (cytosine967-C5)-methyltransferase
VNASADGQRSVRQLASEILLKVDTQKAYADILVDRALKTAALEDRDRALLTEIVYGTLRWRGKIDAKLRCHLRRSLADTAPFLRNLLRATFYQIIFLDKIPAYAAVNEAVKLAKQGGDRSAGFINGVLRSFLRQENKSPGMVPVDHTIDALAEEYSHPEWLVRRWLGEFGFEEATALMRASNERPPLVLRVNSQKSSRELMLDRLREIGISAKPAQFSPQGVLLANGGVVERLPGFAAGFFQVQGEASQLITHLLAPQPGERILDACAAPGGKATHIAERMRDEGDVLALDASARGIDRIGENALRLALQSVHPVRGDATHELSSAVGKWFDRILVDAPCSGLGTLRSHPEIKWQRGESDIQRLCQVQKKILQNVAGYLKPGGVLVYSTCTLTDDENDRVVEGFLRARSEFELEDAARYLPNEARHLVRGEYFQALPQRHNTDGFFAARMRKVL